jgi:asparagine synthase (glutamine-hydrolysing)
LRVKLYSMCRIAGVVGRQTFAKDYVQRMTLAQAHGGPDGEGVFHDPETGVSLGHRRLALIDLSEAGQQPMFSPDGSTVVVFNGEIYNYKELRDELQKAGAVFATRTDTEVILAAFQTWGAAAFGRFNGMFALALYHRPARRLWLVRDPAGVKPLYFNLTPDRLIFASEVRAFLAAEPQWPADPRWPTLFLAFGHIPQPYSTLRGVNSLQPGHQLEVDTDTLAAKTQLLAPPWPQHHHPPANAALAQTWMKETLLAAVKRHLLADAPLGVFLSGGIDSSLLALLAHQLLPAGTLQTLSVVFKEANFSEEPYQQLVLAKLKGRHQRYLVDAAQFEAALPDVWAAMDQPSNDGINSYFVSRCARQMELKAVLSGIGADELFGGYPSFKRAGWLRYLRHVPRALARLASWLPQERAGRLAFLQVPGPVGDYLVLRGFFSPAAIAELLGLTQTAVLDTLHDLVPHYPYREGIDEAYIAFLEKRFYMGNQLLPDTDRMSMWHGLEVRVPYLDRQLWESADLLPPAGQMGKADWPKPWLTQPFQTLLPPQIVFRKKQGFTFPFQVWLSQALAQGWLGQPLVGRPLAHRLHHQFATGRLHWSRWWVLVVLEHFGGADRASG